MTPTPDDAAQAYLAAYDAELRGEAEVLAAISYEQVGPLWRARFSRGGFVTYPSLEGYDAASVRDLVAQTVAHFRDETDVPQVEWKARGHDDVPGLEAALAEAGFVAGEVETVMVGEASALARETPLPDGVGVRRLETTDTEALAAATELQREVFGGGPDLAGLLERGAGDVEVWIAETEQAGGRPITCGRLDLVPGTRFAGLWGGATRPAWRGHGVYRALTAARARSALAHGHSLLQSDCTTMSQPILERSGLVAVTTTTPYDWTRS